MGRACRREALNPAGPSEKSWTGLPPSRGKRRAHHLGPAGHLPHRRRGGLPLPQVRRRPPVPAPRGPPVLHSVLHPDHPAEQGRRARAVHHLPHPLRHGRAQPADRRADADRAARQACGPRPRPCCGPATRPARPPGSARWRSSPGPGRRATPTPTWTRTWPGRPRRSAAPWAGWPSSSPRTRGSGSWPRSSGSRLADGPLTGPERQTIQAVAAGLAMTPAQAIGVVTHDRAGRAENLTLARSSHQPQRRRSSSDRPCHAGCC